MTTFRQYLTEQAGTPLKKFGLATKVVASIHAANNGWSEAYAKSMLDHIVVPSGLVNDIRYVHEWLRASENMKSMKDIDAFLKYYLDNDELPAGVPPRIGKAIEDLFDQAIN